MLFLLCILSYANPIVEGDVLWSKKIYHEAVQKWQEGKEDPHQAISVMAQYRLLLVSSNIMLPFDLIAVDQEMSACDLEDPQCLLARIDREIIFRSLGFPHNEDLAIDLLQMVPETLAEEKNKRLCWLLASEKCFPGPIERGPGGAVLSIGFFLGQQIGLGTRLGYRIPNVDNKMGKLQLRLDVGTGNYGLVGFQYDRYHPFWIRTEVDLRKINYFRFRNDEWEQTSVSSTQGSLSVGYADGDNYIWIGPQFRWEKLDSPISAHGLTFGLQLGPENLRISQYVDASFTSYFHVRSTTTIQAKHPIGLAVQARADICPNTEAPWWRFPTAGGGQHLRLPPAQWLRSSNIYTGILEWHILPKQTLGGVLFFEGAYTTEQSFMGGGIGARIRVPPSPRNNLRLDVGYGNLGWGVFANIGEQF